MRPDDQGDARGKRNGQIRAFPSAATVHPRIRERVYLKSLHAPAALRDRGQGWISWPQGRALNRFMDSTLCEHGAYQQGLAALDLKKSTAGNRADAGSLSVLDPSRHV